MRLNVRKLLFRDLSAVVYENVQLGQIILSENFTTDERCFRKNKGMKQGQQIVYNEKNKEKRTEIGPTSNDLKKPN